MDTQVSRRSLSNVSSSESSGGEEDSFSLSWVGAVRAAVDFSVDLGAMVGNDGMI